MGKVKTINHKYNDIVSMDNLLQGVCNKNIK